MAREFHDEHILETNVSSESVFDGIILHIEHLTNKLPNGKLAKREVARHIGAAAVIPVDDEGNVYMVRQFRSPVDRVLLEIPAGKLDFKGEDRLDAAKRELREETGLISGEWTHLNDLLTTVGFCDECIGIYMARNLTTGDSEPDEDEFLRADRMPLDVLLQRILRNEIADAKTVAGVLKAKLYLNI